MPKKLPNLIPTKTQAVEWQFGKKMGPGKVVKTQVTEWMSKGSKLARGLEEASNKSLIMEFMSPQKISDAAMGIGKGGRGKRKA